MRTACIMILLAMAILTSCNPVESDILLDELQDKKEYTSGLMVNCESFLGEKTGKIILNHQTLNKPDNLDLRSPGYYRIEIFTDNEETAAGVIRMVILDPERGDSEWGLPVWTPRGLQAGIIGEETLKLVYTPMVPANSSSPFVLIAGGELTESLVNLRADIEGRDFLIKRGAGSAWLPPTGDHPAVLTIDQRSINLETTVIETNPISLSGTVNTDQNIPAGSYLNIPGDLSIAGGVTLSIEEGSYITIDEGVNIYNQGTLRMEGSEELPVTITCSDDQKFWGGITGTEAGNSVQASHTLFCRSGYHSGGEYDYGHAHRQALFYSEYGSVTLDHCYMIDHAGQVFYPVFGTLDISHCLVQRAITGGQANSSEVFIDHSVFTDFPDDSRVYQDQDNDCLYLMQSNATISNSIFMYAVDDGLDSGGSGGGNVRVSHTRFESIFHEGAALSSGDQVSKNHTFTNCTFMDCGQGLELGYSSPNHHVSVDSCSFRNNAVGIRYGDNYTTPHAGYISVSNSESLDNSFQDVWNMLREDWNADTAAMEFNNVRVSRANPLYPQLEVNE